MFKRKPYIEDFISSFMSSVDVNVTTFVIKRCFSFWVRKNSSWSSEVVELWVRFLHRTVGWAWLHCNLTKVAKTWRLSKIDRVVLKNSVIFCTGSLEEAPSFRDWFRSSPRESSRYWKWWKPAHWKGKFGVRLNQKTLFFLEPCFNYISLHWQINWFFCRKIIRLNS